MHHSTHGNSDGHHWYAVFIILCFLMTHFKDLSQAHTIVYLKKYRSNSKIPTFTPNLLNQNIESLSTICRLQETKMFKKRPPLVASQYNSMKSIKESCFFCSCISVVLFNTPGISRYHNTLFLSSPYFWFILGFICDLFISCVIHWCVRKPSCGPNVLNHCRGRG